MNKKALCTLMLNILLFISAFAQHPYDAIKQDVRRAGGVFNLYNFNTPAPTKAPKGYKPFYISHYGRHGSRMSSYNDTYEIMNTMLTETHKSKKLTNKGEEFYKIYKDFYPELRFRGGDLTTRGQKEQHKLAHRMYKNYPEVFKKGIKATAASTNSPRAMMSMYAFLEGIRECQPQMEIHSSASLADINSLNPFTVNNPDVAATDAGFQNNYAAWLEQLDSYAEKYRTPEKILFRVFSDTTGIHQYGQDLDIEQYFYEICECAQCMEGKDLLWEIFDIDELCHMWEWNSLKYYLSKGPAPHSNGRQWAFVWRTMQDVIDKADAAIKSPSPVIDFRFGHDITIMAMMTLLDIEGWNKAVNDEEAMYHWQEYRVPMAANTQFVFYKNKDNDVIVRFMLNEVEQKLPIPSDIAPYYKWEDLKKYAEQRIKVAKNIIKNTAPPKKRPIKKLRKSSLG